MIVVCACVLLSFFCARVCVCKKNHLTFSSDVNLDADTKQKGGKKKANEEEEKEEVDKEKQEAKV